MTVKSTNSVRGNLAIDNGDVVIDVDGSGDVNVAFAAYNGSTVDLSGANIQVADKSAAVYVPKNVETVINVDNTTMTVGNGGHGVFVPQGAKDLKINFTNSTITGSPYALYLMQTNSVVTFDANSTVNEFWVMGGNVDVIYSGTKPVVKTDGLAVNLNLYTKDEYAFSDVFDADGGELTFTEDLTLSNSVTVAAGQDVKLNLDGNKLNVERRSVVNGNLNINGGDIDVNIPTTSSIQMGFVADNGSQIDIVDANITVAPKNTAITIFNTDYNYHNIRSTINLTNTTIVSEGYGIQSPLGAEYVEINLVNSSITGKNTILLQDVKEAVITVDANSHVDTIAFEGSGTLTVKYAGTKPNVTGSNITFVAL